MTSFGFLGIIPPLLAIVIAFISKDVVVSLFIGVLSATLIVVGGNPILAAMRLTDLLADIMADGWNIRIFMFCALIGGLIGMISRTGATASFGRWASRKLKTSTGSQFMTFLLGLLIFIDDGFNSLAVGTVMRPICDKTKISRAKLAFILDSTAAPICVIAPVSSWVVAVMSIVRDSDGFELLGMSPLDFFLRSIPYNLYALGTLIFVVCVIFSKRDFGPMLESEKLAQQGKFFNEKRYGAVAGQIPEGDENRAKPIDMIFPIALLVLTALIFFATTSYMNAIDGENILTFSDAVKSMTLADAFKNTDSAVALFYAIIFTIFGTYIYYLARRLMNLSECGESLRDGIKSMVPGLVTLALSWSIGTIIRATPDEGGLGLGVFLSELVVGARFPLGFIPVIVFALAAVTALSTGTSWGTFGMMIPIVMPIVTGLSQAAGLTGAALQNQALIAIAAVIGGAVFGDHASPISDTSILSSNGASCPHLEHVATQMPYAIFVAVCAGAGFFIGGLTKNIFAAWIVMLAVMAAGLVILPNTQRRTTL